MHAIKKENVDSVNFDELENIASNIENKLKLLDIKLPKLAEQADVDYFTLRKIINREPDYMPNLRVLSKLADFFNINAGDLIRSASLPQYVPTITLEQVEEFLDKQIPEFELQDKIFVDSYIHDLAFSIRRALLNFNIQTMVEHICYPTNKFYKNGIFVVKLNNTLRFIQVITIKNNIIYFKDDKSEDTLRENINNVVPLAVTVKFVLNQNII